ncbi:hypothetical protein F2Q70_00030375 [Brassica cretica]|uniref:Uncharacterized protein n=1 Tax=Brassica cretica TaxID=69181 RepID=A0A8S9FI43_BRACR|nr:hypothetical protein F2Q70_00030375 [Brassica cretica]
MLSSFKSESRRFGATIRVEEHTSSLKYVEDGDDRHSGELVPALLLPSSTKTRKELKALQDKIDILLADKATQEQLHFVGNPSQETPPVVHEVEGLEGQEELCFINNNGSWYKKEPNFQYNNYQQKSYPNNQQSGYPPRNNQQGSYQPQQNPSSGSSAPQESSTDTLLKQILESQTRSEKHVGYELKNLHSKIDGSYNELNNKRDLLHWLTYQRHTRLTKG